MNETKPALPAEIGGTEITRFNALRHGVLSRYTVLPWEDADEYRDLVASLVAEHAPQGPTEEHLVEELAGILWRKRRLRLAEAAAHRHGLDEALSQSQRTAKAAVVHIDAADGSEDVAEAIRATAADTEDAIRDMEEDEAMTRQALDLLNSRRNDAYEAATGGTARGHAAMVGRHAGPRPRRSWKRTRNRPPPTPRDCGASWRARCCRGSRTRKKELANRPLIREQAFGEALDPDKLERLGRYEVHLDRKLERMLAMLLRLKDLRQGAIAG